MRSLSFFVAFAALAAPAGGALADNAALGKAVASDQRTASFVARDQYRKPLETLAFVGVQPHHTVVEIAPGGGYWTEILGPYLKDKGTYYTVLNPRSNERATAAADAWEKKLGEQRGVYGEVKISYMDQPAPAGTADVVMTSRNVHNWMAQGSAEEMFTRFFTALKSGGVLSVSDHRASDQQPQDPKAKTGYVREDTVIAMAEKAGFKLVSRSEILANPKDTKDHPSGVWTLPPTLALGEQDRAKYQAIGEADNFLLKFQKP